MRNGMRLVLGLLASAPTVLAAQGTATTRIVILGTGNPAPTPATAGPSIAIVVNGTPYLVDAGVGLVRRAQEAHERGIAGFEMPKLQTVFLTHLHSDHTIGLPDLLETPWIMGRSAPLRVYGPAGTRAMMSHLMQAWSADNDIRINGLERGNRTGNKAIAHEIKPGVVYRDSNVTVTAFLVNHGSWRESFGYRFDTPDRSIVVSGDTAPSDAVADACHGCDVLVHEAYSQKGYEASTDAWKKYARAFHTSIREVAQVATRARPGLLLLHHQMYFGRQAGTDTYETMLAELSQIYAGKIASARDLDVF